MKNYYVIILILVISCKRNYNDENIIMKADISELYKTDQKDRSSDEMNWSRVSKRDLLRRKRVAQLIDSNFIKSAIDYYKTAMIYQHGDDSSHYALAIKYMKKAINLDSTIPKRLFAAATDRYLLSIGKSQIYGTQYYKEILKPWVIRDFDSTKISDNERQKYGVKTLAEQKAKLEKLNAK